MKYNAEAQSLPEKYLQSVKEFFSDWAKIPEDSAYTILETIYDPLGDHVFDKDYLENHRTPYHKDQADSITLTTEELVGSIQSYEETKVGTWPIGIFPDDQFRDSLEYHKKHKIRKGVPCMISLPYFFMNNRFALVHYYRVFFGDCEEHWGVVYTKKKGHWRRYGELYYGYGGMCQPTEPHVRH